MNEIELYEYLRNLLFTTDHIYMTYDIIKDVEYLNPNDKNIKMGLIENINRLRIIEKKEYDNNFLSDDEIVVLIRYLIYSDNVKINNIKDGVITSLMFDSIINGNKCNLIKTRVIQKLLQIYRDDDNQKVLDILNRDVFINFILNTEKICQESNDGIVKNSISENKYNVIFAFKDIEDELHENDFDIKKPFMFISPCVCGLNNINDKLYDTVRVNYLSHLVRLCISEIKKYDDTTYKFKKDNNKVKLIKELLKSSMLLLNNEEIVKLKKEYIFYKTENSSSLFLKGDSIILNVFENMKNEKEKYLTLNLIKKSN